MTVQMLDLGWCIGRLDGKRNTLRVVSPSDSSEGIHAPAESILLGGESVLITLRDALNAAYPDKGE